ncbi:4Fe-4S dicluster domain-containing protein [bacterium]|nr:4Fe-4S dicluster domain-containing protein [bacterium]
MSRRRFLKWVGAANLALIPGELAVASSGHHFEGYPNSGGVLYDNALCIGCRKCEEGCNKVNEHAPPDKPFDDLSVFEEKRRTGNQSFTVVNRYQTAEDPDDVTFKKVQCNHCLEPACAAVCFVKAFKKTPSGAVVYDETVCVGCRYCMMACPFEIPTYEYDEAFTPRVQKCTLCHPRLEKGLLPGCVEACPTQALTFGKREKLLKIARERIKNHPGKYIDHIYGEKEMGGTSWLYLSKTEFSNVGFKENLGNKPALEFTSGAISAVPIVVGLWPVFLLGAYAMNKRIDKNAKEETEEAVKISLQQAKDASDAKLVSALEKAANDNKREIEKAVNKALAEAESKKEDNQDTQKPLEKE